MIGKLLSAVTQVVTLPLDIVNAGLTAIDGGTPSSKEDRSQVPILGDLASGRDEICKIMEDIDKP